MSCALAGVLLVGCAQTRVTWRAGLDVQPLPPDAPVRLYVRHGVIESVRKDLAALGAEEVVAFPPGDRIAEIEALDSPWLTWSRVLGSVKERARQEGADTAVLTGGLGSMTTESVLYFQLLRR